MVNNTNVFPLKRPSKQKNKNRIAQEEHELINDMVDGQAQDVQMQNIVF